jgi:hypothetical protein
MSNGNNDFQNIVLTQEMNVINNQTCNQEPQSDSIKNENEENIEDNVKGRWRGGLFECCYKFQCPQFCFVLYCPCITIAQLHYNLWKFKNSKFALYGFFGIIAYFIILILLAAINPWAAPHISSVWWISNVFLLSGLLGRARDEYNIRGNCFTPFCYCSDACADLTETCCCYSCSLMRLGHHVYNYGWGFMNQHLTYAPIGMSDEISEAV